MREFRRNGFRRHRPRRNGVDHRRATGEERQAECDRDPDIERDRRQCDQILPARDVDDDEHHGKQTRQTQRVARTNEC